MSYKIEVRKNHRAYPVIICDHCQKTITETHDGSALWFEDLGTSVDKRFEVFHVHYDCERAFERTHPEKDGARWVSNEIDHHLFMLLHNCRYDAKAAKRKATVLAMLD